MHFPHSRHFFHLIDPTRLYSTCNWVNRAGNAFAFSRRGYHLPCMVYPSRGRLSSSSSSDNDDDDSTRLASPRLASPRLALSIHYICTIRNVCVCVSLCLSVCVASEQFGYPILAALSLWIVYWLAKGMSGPELRAYFNILLIILMGNKRSIWNHLF